MVRKLSGALLLLAQLSASYADNTRVVNEVRYVDDSEDASQQMLLLGYQWRPALTQRDDKLLFSLGRWELDDPVGTEDFDVYRLSYDTPLSARTQLRLRTALLESGDWSPWVGQASVIHVPAERWRFEAAYEREVIDTVPAIRQHLRGDSYSASADYALNPRWTVVAGLLHQSIDDGNRRDGGVLRVIYSAPRIPGFTVQTRSRLVHSDFDGAGYFSPPELEEHLLLFGYGTALAGERWRVSVLGGPGRQRFEDSAGDETSNSLYYAELRARGWFTERVGLEGQASCSNTGGPNSGAPDDDYRYCHAQVSLLFAW